MTRPKEKKRRRLSRLDRIERKCDRILSEVIMIRHNVSMSRPDVDEAIERMHQAATRMRRQCEGEYMACRSFLSKT